MTDRELLDQKPLVDSFLGQGPRPLSAFSFVSLFAWCDFFEFEFKIIKDHLCVFAKGDSGCFLYLPPLGRGFDPSTLDSCFKHMAQGGALKPVNRIENIPSNLLSAFDPDRYNQYIKPEEYVYRKADLTALKGNAYKSQRHDCNLFRAHHPQYVFEPYQAPDLAACMQLYDHWARQRALGNTDEIYRCMLQENRRVHERLLSASEPLGLVARVLRVKDRVIGYTFGFGIDEKTFCVYAEIVDLSATGSAAFLFRNFCSDDELKEYVTINTMDDFAMPQVARAKKAYHPMGMIPSYSVALKKEAY